MRAPMVPAPRTATLLIFLCIAVRGLSEWGDEGASGEPFPGALILISTVDGKGGAAVSGMGQLQGVGPKNVLAQGTHSTPRRGSGNRGHSQARAVAGRKHMRRKESGSRSEI